MDGMTGIGKVTRTHWWCSTSTGIPYEQYIIFCSIRHATCAGHTHTRIRPSQSKPQKCHTSLRGGIISGISRRNGREIYFRCSHSPKFEVLHPYNKYPSYTYLCPPIYLIQDVSTYPVFLRFLECGRDANNGSGGDGDDMDC